MSNPMSSKSVLDKYLFDQYATKEITQNIEKLQPPMVERLNVLGMIASGIAHDINGPLSTIKACSDGLLRRMKKNKYDPALFKSYLEIIEEEVERCAFITGNILRFLQNTKENHLDHQVDVHASLDQTIRMLTIQGKCGGIEIIRNLEPVNKS